ncbi:hypothetical protein OGR47_14945 [Methylocystis sp. MJC1]|jgi:hypothetical protein|uniref:hypothetical protein n=1 Tax=Methylocystis sp. MJC1 TaxID=2654282 RepID=UPI0013ED23F0|nr:hypothetical protein [Methylocystis sp. MJC1]KAF2990465.1 hypothetical protein MJC1_02565 [Methylocystis sp. MJC1]MBU6528260.1 hypothetical protein [Methylocystis sp. MJC1]UZX11167.1 hypothetical protein OGR47_14945 [Methylocystis sp. MJC1]
MADFVFEIIERGKVRPETTLLSLPDERALWGAVEALALKLAGWQGAFIRVKNARGEPLIRAGVSTALSSIENCCAEDCPLKRELKHFRASGRHSAAEPDLLVDCSMARPRLAA